MPNTSEAERYAPLIQAATMAMLDALERLGIADNAGACLAAVGALAGLLAANCETPEEALAAVNAIARGIIDGTLVD